MKEGFDYSLRCWRRHKVSLPLTEAQALKINLVFRQAAYLQMRLYGAGQNSGH